MTDVGHIFDWITERLRSEIIDHGRDANEAAQMVLDATNREDRQLIAEFFINCKASAFDRMRREVGKMLGPDA